MNWIKWQPTSFNEMKLIANVFEILLRESCNSVYNKGNNIII